MSDNNPTDTDGEIPSRPQKRSHSSITMPPADEMGRTHGFPTTTSSEDKPGPLPSPTKEELYELAKARKIAQINNRNLHLRSEIERIGKEIEAQRAQLLNKDAAATVRQHIKLLHEYNEIRDVGQGMIGMIADNRGVRIADLYESGEFGVGVKD